MGGRTAFRKEVGAALVTVSCALSLIGGSAAAADPRVGNVPDRTTQPNAGECTAMVLDPQRVNVYPSTEEPYEFLVQGAVHIDDPTVAAGCTLRVCVEEEHGAGNWHAEGCGRSTVDPSESDYYSLTPYVDCDNDGDSATYRSQARFEGSTVTRVGAARYVCG